MKKIIFTIIALAITQTITAQHINNVLAFKSEKKNTATLNLEFDPAIFWGISYNRNFDVSIGDFNRKIVGQVGWKSYQFNYSDLNLNVYTQVLDHPNFNVITNIGIENKYLKNVVHQANIYNWAVGFMPVYYSNSNKWYAGMELMYKRLYAVKYKHTDYYREVYPEVKDGWYKYKNAYLNVSVNLGAKISNSFDIDLRGGYRFTNDFQNYRPYITPYFGDLAVNYRF